MNQQKGISLIITFFVMVIMLAMVLGTITILFSQTKIITNTLNSFSAFYAADTGVEKTLYLNKISSQTGSGIAARFCNICSTCSNTTNDCIDCALTPIVPDGCNPLICNNCRLTYSSIFDNRKFNIDATVTNPGNIRLIINSSGFYVNATRTSQFDSNKN